MHIHESAHAVQLLAISGSLRGRSSNGAIVRAASLVAGPGVIVSLYEGLSGLPYFNPDEDLEPPPLAVGYLRTRIRAADAVLISSPEYAHGVPGALKNALDWVVGSGEFMHKPVGIVNASLGSTFASASLAETLRVMMAELVPEACVSVPVAGRPLDAAGIAGDPELGPVLGRVVAALTAAARAQRAALAPGAPVG